MPAKVGKGGTKSQPPPAKRKRTTKATIKARKLKKREKKAR